MAKRRVAAVVLALAAAIALAAFSRPVLAVDENAVPAPRIELAILLDTSGSMEGLIDQARTQLWKVVNEFSGASLKGRRPELHVALYEYGNDGLPADKGHLRMIVPLTDDLDKVSEELFKLTTNGGSEHCGEVIDRAVSELKWSKAAADVKCIFIAGNEAFTQGPVDFRDACRKAAQAGVTVSTIFCGPVEVGVQTMWAEGAKLADGSFMAIDQNRVVQAIDAPQDKQLTQLSGELNKTYVAYGTADERKVAADRQLQQDSNASDVSQATAAARAQVKCSALYNNARWDICDAYSQNKIKLEDLTEEQLPDELKKLNFEQRKVYIEKMVAQRKALLEQMQQLSQARQEYIAAELKKQAASGADTLDKALIECVRSQAGRKSFKWE